MNRLLRDLTVLTLFLSFNAACAAGQAVSTFEEDGVVVDVLELFPRAIKDARKVEKTRTAKTLEEVAARALVTKEGVYAFLETPETSAS